MKLTGENRQLGEKPVPVPLCPPQVSHGLTWDRTQASAVRGRRLMALHLLPYVIARKFQTPCSCLSSFFCPAFEVK
jgi:hypothetical protein